MNLKFLVFTIIGLAIFNTQVSAKRVYIEYPDKVISENIEYSSSYESSLLTQKAFVVATNLKTKKTIWKKKIYTILLNPIIEQDVQWKMITSIEKEGNKLKIKNEKGQQFFLDLTTLDVDKIK